MTTFFGYLSLQERADSGRTSQRICVVTSAVIAAVLFISAALKSIDPLPIILLPQLDAHGQYQLSMLVTQVELMLAFWLVSRFYPRTSWRFATALFLLFGAVTLYQALSGGSSCGCFGALKINPWITL